MTATAPAEILPAPIGDFRLPPGIELPQNVVMTESEAAHFLRETPARLRAQRLAGTGPTFFLPPGRTWGARYLLWDLLSWAANHRRREMPESIAA